MAATHLSRLKDQLQILANKKNNSNELFITERIEAKKAEYEYANHINELTKPQPGQILTIINGTNIDIIETSANDEIVEILKENLRFALSDECTSFLLFCALIRYCAQGQKRHKNYSHPEIYDLNKLGVIFNQLQKQFNTAIQELNYYDYTETLKISITMQETLNDLFEAGFYYVHEANKLISMYERNKVRNMIAIQQFIEKIGWEAVYKN